MFNKVSGVTYTIDDDIARSLTTDTTHTVHASAGDACISKYILEDLIKRMLSHEVALLVYHELRTVLDSNGFIVIKFGTESLSFMISVGLMDDELVYGILNK